MCARSVCDVTSDDDPRAATPSTAAVQAILARHGISSRAITAATRGSFPVFFVGDDLVMKLVPDRWRAKYEIERRTMHHLATLPLNVRVPAVIAEGDAERCGYLVMTRLAGRPLVEVFDALAPVDRRRIVRELGAMMRAIHDAPVGPVADLAIDWPTFVATQCASAPARHAQGGEAWASELAPFLAEVAPSLVTFRPALMTADITNEHVLLEERDGRIEVSGFFDFGDAMVGDPVYDLVTPATFIVRGREDLMSALLDGYGLAEVDRTPTLRRRCLAYQLLHRFARLGRDVGMLASPIAPATLADVERALYPFALTADRDAPLPMVHS